MNAGQKHQHMKKKKKGYGVNLSIWITSGD